MPATRGDLAAHANGEKLPFLRSMIFCTEDAVRLDQLDLALQNLKESLPLFRPTEALRFIRVRNPQIMGEVLRMPGIKNVDGFVLPKATRKNITRYLELLSKNDGFLLMPTLEDSDVFVPAEMVKFRNFLLGSSVRSRILSLRIGGSDLLHQLGVRRSPRRSVYDTALGPAIAMLSGIFITGLTCRPRCSKASPFPGFSPRRWSATCCTASLEKRRCIPTRWRKLKNPTWLRRRILKWPR
jgi:citrate lyase beta subunit